MAFTDEEKLYIAKHALKSKIVAIDDWTAFKDLILTVTSTKLKNLIKNAIQDKKDACDVVVSDNSTLSTNLGELKTEVEGLQ